MAEDQLTSVPPTLWPPSEQPKRDGRSARSDRTREALVSAVLALVDAGNLQPTAQEIAKQAGVSARSVFQHFPEREQLWDAVAWAQFGRLRERFKPPPAVGSFETRLEAFVAQRCEFYETITPVRRAALLREPFSPTAHAWLQEVRRAKRAQMLDVFTAELEAFEEPRRGEVAAALGAATSWSAWEALRNQQDLEPDAACAVMRRSILGLLRKD